MSHSPRILLINGHPEAGSHRLNHTLLEAYAQGAREAGYEIRQIDVAALDFPLLRSQEEWEHGTLPPALVSAQGDIAWAKHLVFFFPLWLGDMPALLKGFLEQVARPGFAFHKDADNPFGQKALGGRSARVVVTRACYRDVIMRLRTIAGSGYKSGIATVMSLIARFPEDVPARPSA